MSWLIYVRSSLKIGHLSGLTSDLTFALNQYLSPCFGCAGNEGSRKMLVCKGLSVTALLAYIIRTESHETRKLYHMRNTHRGFSNLYVLVGLTIRPVRKLAYSVTKDL